MPRYEETAKLNTEAEIHLYELDVRPLGLNESFYFCNYADSGGSSIFFAAREYLPIPVMGSSFGLSITNADETPKIIVADVGRVVSAILQQVGGELGGGLLKRTKVYRENLDNGLDPDPMAAFPTETYTIDTQEFNGVVYSFSVGSIFNFTSAQIPRRRIRELLDDSNA